MNWGGFHLCFALLKRIILGPQVTRPTRPVTLTCERPAYAQWHKSRCPVTTNRTVPTPSHSKGAQQGPHSRIAGSVPSTRAQS